MEISGHSSTRMLGRYTHPTEERKVGALETFRSALSTNCPQTPVENSEAGKLASEIAELLKEFGGRQEARTPDLRVANAKTDPQSDLVESSKSQANPCEVEHSEHPSATAMTQQDAGKCKP